MSHHDDEPQVYFENGWEALADYIIFLAVQDYQISRRKLRRNPDHKTAARTVRELERFFRSRWFSILTDADGNKMLERLKWEEASRDRETKKQGGIGECCIRMTNPNRK